MLRIVSLNCWGGRIYEPLLRYLQEIDADVVCLQEVYSAPPNVPKGLTFVYEHRPQQEPPVCARLYADLKATLPEYQAFFYPTIQGYLYDKENARHKVRFGIATFVRESLSIIGEGVDFMYGSYRDQGWGEPPLPTNAHCLRLWRHDRATPIVVAHMHGIWVPTGKADTPERIQQAKRLIDLVQRVGYAHDDMVVCGDFNVLPDSETFDILGLIGLRDHVVATGITDTRTRFYTKEPRYADYMLVSPQVRVANFDVPAEPEVSDHRPLVLECE